jgi:hypothetical protein
MPFFLDMEALRCETCKSFCIGLSATRQLMRGKALV